MNNKETEFIIFFSNSFRNFCNFHFIDFSNPSFQCYSRNRNYLPITMACCGSICGNLIQMRRQDFRQDFRG